ncbi:CG1233 [Drosophila busckii]|uniref:CG1233 n=1 Tax=Drosophila busckii TaxID=30019 RepID=A0A0M4EL17_DROBS|nr:uncharacterized protein LOC108601100 [Drosophila busckii]ALC44060.1 CG1233 [Drosophila busckii]
MLYNMNEADVDVAFSSFYSTVGNQLPHTELSLCTPTSTLHDSFGGFFEDDQALLSLPTTTSTSAIVEASCIPFVQIHTTDLQQQCEPNRSYRNGFRRKTAEIKSEAELIKSELAEAAAKERTNATPTPPTAKPMSTDGSTELPLNKCPNCPFLSLCQLKTQNHMSSCFGVDTQQRLQCPGCANVFYHMDVLHLHLSTDHQLEQQEISTLLRTMPDKSSEGAAKRPQQLAPQVPKSRIFIKNVDCLREPHREQDVSQLPDFLPMLSSPVDGSAGSILDLLDDVSAVEPANTVTSSLKPVGQKISIKSVDVLREPALLPYDFQLPTATVADQALPPLMVHNNLLEVQPEKPRQPKIYIRNVDILKEPMLLPDMGFAAPVSSVTGPTEVFNADALLTPTGSVGALPGFEPTLAPLANMCNEPFSFDAVLNGAGAVGSSNTFSALDLDFGVDFDNGVQLVTEPTPPPAEHAIIVSSAQQLSELAPVPAHELSTQLESFLPSTAQTGSSSSKQKIFIKNVDILKAPQRGTLHLRTVDELNLMNRNEVEHLIVPHREPLSMELPISATTAVLESGLVNFEQQQVSLQAVQPTPVPAPSVGYDDGYDLAQNLECWPWMEETVTESMTVAETEQPAVQLELPSCSDDLLIKDFAQLYTSSAASTEAAVPTLLPTSPVAASVSSTEGSLSSLPVPPLVPLAAEAASAVAPAAAAATTGDGKPARIYVANNLLPAVADATQAAVQAEETVRRTSVRGRPYGARQSTGQAKRSNQSVSQVPEAGKCTIDGCMFRFRSPSTLEYHSRCHNGALGSAQPMICPECKSTQFSNWNCLHTHLWRTHEIDMELYCCQLCSFKTPIYSRLVNTHAKIHSEERNYKCEQCGKGFKNTKQLKNHRRLHRTQGLGMPKPQLDSSIAVHRCDDCGAAFKQRKTLREHLCKQRNEQPQCSNCQRVFSSKSSLKLHMRSHQDQKRFKCDKCEHEANDHNAFRRHLATHRESKRYACPHCDFRAIQSTAYRIHLEKRHPEQELSTIIHKCNVCNFSSINRGLLLVHQAKHEAPAIESSKIKVKSNLLLAHSTGLDQTGKVLMPLENALNA